MIILNLTQHQPTTEQVAAGVINLSTEQWGEVKSLLTFSTLQETEEVSPRADKIAAIAEAVASGEEIAAMIGGAPYLMTPLVESLKDKGITPLYSFTERTAVEETIDGKTVKRSVFQHVGWVEA